MPGLILLVDGNVEERALAAFVLRQGLADHVVEEVGDAIVLAERLVRDELAAVVTEAELPWASGLDVLESVKRLRPACPVVLFTGQGSESIAAEGIRRGLDGYVIKRPGGYLALPAAVRDAMERAAQSARQAGGARFETLLAELPLGLFVAARDGTITEATPAAARLLGAAEADAVTGENLLALVAEPARRQLQTALERGQPLRDLEIEVSGAAGERTWLRLNLCRVAEIGRPRGRWEGCVEDITPFKRAERQTAERAAALTRSNEELQQFSYVISHDLQEPLQLISRYTQLVVERWAGRLDTDAQRYLAHVLTSAARMQAMINDVLEYARVETRGRPFAAVDSESALVEALAGLKAVVEETGARVTWHGLPRLMADGGQLVQLFQNLLSNAIKFRSEKPPRVQVSAVETEQGWVFAVADNGVGIPEGQLERIFGMFQRLHTAEEVPGTGIGLAICKRIVERHGGQIWATSSPGEGATFYFSIPRQGAVTPAEARTAGGGGEDDRRRAARPAR